jgi:2-dehydro-3-deoxyglucarate aldolase
MNKLDKIKEFRNLLKLGKPSIGSWMQLPSSSVAEIMGDSGYDWIAVDLEHGSFSLHQLPDIFRALELGGTIPMARLTEGTPANCKQALDSGACGVIIPNIKSSNQLKSLIDSCQWPPSGNRGVGFSRANLFGKYFNSYKIQAQNPIVIAMIENISAVDSLEDILSTQGLDAILIGPYDLSGSMNITGNFNDDKFIRTIKYIRDLCKKHNVASGIHVVEADSNILSACIKDGYQFVAFSIDAVFLSKACELPKLI